MKRAAIYVRVSTNEQADGGYSLDAQLRACRQFVAQQEWFLVDEYIDRGESARTADRPEFQRMLAELVEKAVSVVVVHKLDRFARNVGDHIAVRARLSASNVQLRSVTETIDDSANGKFMENVMASMAELYSANLGQEARKGMLQKARNGLWPSVAPIGYRNVRTDTSRKAESLLHVDPETAPFVSQSFELYASGGWSLTALSNEMARRGLRTRHGGPLSRSKFATMLKNPIYVGIVRWADIEVPGKHEALVSQAVFDEVQRAMATHDKASPRIRKHDHYLKGTLRCANCGSRMGTTVAKGHEYFFCLGRHRRRTACREPYVPTTNVEEEVERIYKATHFSAEGRRDAEQYVEEQNEQYLKQTSQAANRYKKQLAALIAQRKKLMTAYYQDAVPLDLFKTEQARIANELIAIESSVALDRGVVEKTQEAVHWACDLLEACGKAYIQADRAVRAKWNAVLFERIDVRAGRVLAHSFAEPFRSVITASGLNSDLLVARMGFEPMTFSLKGDR